MKSVRSCIGTLVVLVLFRVGEIAEACSCSPVHPQQAFCNADVVIRAKVVGKKEVDSGNDIYGNPIKRIQYEIKQIKMFKGPDRHIDVIFTAPSSAVCGVTNLETNGKKEYLISGKAEANGKMHVTLCDLIMPWESMSATQKKSLSQRYQTGCDCKITRCATFPCEITAPVRPLCLHQERRWLLLLVPWSRATQERVSGFGRPLKYLSPSPHHPI
uniref:Metalloproteinase inhibitor 2 n=1 Tax=Cyprinus carpio TaxID=7962 RepID=A0A8C2H0S9_CYPCA